MFIESQVQPVVALAGPNQVIPQRSQGLGCLWEPLRAEITVLAARAPGVFCISFYTFNTAQNTSPLVTRMGGDFSQPKSGSPAGTSWERRHSVPTLPTWG